MTTSSIPLGRLAGVRIGVNWSWLVVFGLIVWTLAASVFPEQNPGRSHGAYGAMAVAAALLFFASLLLHELGHATQARREGMEIEGITLWLFGGVASFRGTFPRAGAEFRIAIAGPIVSLVLGLAFAGLAWLVPLPEVADGVAAWLGYTNLVLLVFNLLPALPLDGGRVLRSALWQLRGDFAWATALAAWIARGVAYLMIAGGFALLLFVGALSGLWLAFIGWFLLQAAGAEARFAEGRRALGDLRVADLMVRDPVVVAPEATVGDFIDDVAWSRRYTTYPVVRDGRPVGLLAFRCLASIPRSEWDTRTVGDCMIPADQVPTLRSDDRLVDALAELASGEVNRAFVVDDGRLAGFLSITDLARAMQARPPRDGARPGAGRRGSRPRRGAA